MVFLDYWLSRLAASIEAKPLPSFWKIVTWPSKNLQPIDVHYNAVNYVQQLYLAREGL